MEAIKNFKEFRQKIINIGNEKDDEKSSKTGI